jgi:hypothetical protein
MTKYVERAKNLVGDYVYISLSGRITTNENNAKIYKSKTQDINDKVLLENYYNLKFERIATWKAFSTNYNVKV